MSTVTHTQSTNACAPSAKSASSDTFKKMVLETSVLSAKQRLVVDLLILLSRTSRCRTSPIGCCHSLKNEKRSSSKLCCWRHNKKDKWGRQPKKPYLAKLTIEFLKEVQLAEHHLASNIPRLQQPTTKSISNLSYCLSKTRIRTDEWVNCQKNLSTRTEIRQFWL